ncbi:hypothetical protein [Streptomyces sp. NPDC002851]
MHSQSCAVETTCHQDRSCLRKQRLDPPVNSRASARSEAKATGGEERPQGWETVIDCTRAVRAIEDGLARVRRGGAFQQFDVAPSDATASFSPFRVYNDEITIAGSMAVVHSFGLDEFADALQTFREGSGRKIQIRPAA